MLLPNPRAVGWWLAALCAVMAGGAAKAQDEEQVDINDLMEQMRYEEARPLLVELEALWSKAVREDDSIENRMGWSRTLLHLGVSEDRLGKREQALTHLKLARDLAVEGGQGPDFIGACLNELGRSLHMDARHKEAETALMEAVAQRSQISDPDRRRRLVSRSRDHLGLLYLNMSREEEAGRIFHETLALTGDDPEFLAQRHSYLARYYQSLHNWGAARGHWERALQFGLETWPETHPNVISLTGSLGHACLRLDDLLRAEELLTKAAALAEQRPPSHRNTIELATYLNNLGQLAYRNREFEEARDIFSDALQTLTPRLGDSSAALCPFFNNLGYANHRLEDFQAAKEAYYQALVRYRYTLKEEHELYIETNNNLVLNYLLDGEEAGEMRKLVEENTANALAVFDRLRSFGTERQRLNYIQRIDLVSLPCTLGHDPALIANTVLRTKARLLDTLLVEQEEPSPLLEELWGKQRELDDLAFRSETRERIDSLRDEIEVLQNQLKPSGSRQDLAPDAEEPTWQAVQASLPPDSAFVDFVRYRKYQPSPVGPYFYGAILILPKGEPQWIPLGSEDQLRAWLGLMKERLDYRAVRLAGYQTSPPPLRLQAALRKLHDLFWKPVAECLPESTSTIGLSPDGSLNFVSFAVLLDGENRFLSGKFEQVLYVGSGRDLLATEERPALSTGPWAVIAVPDFEEKSAPSEQSSNNALDQVVFETIDNFSPVPGAQEELKLLHRVIPEAARGLELTNASEQDLRSMTTSPVVLHLTTHAFFLPAGRDDSLGSFQDFDQQPERLYRSGLVLTEAKRALADRIGGKAVPISEDGILFSDEVKSLPLQNTRLVTLSSCESGLGEAVSGEGVLGLRRGFTLAGASNILMSLWPVADSSTPAFMERIYRLALATDRIGQSVWTTQQRAFAQVDPGNDDELEEAVLRYGCFVLCQRGPLQSAVTMPEIKNPATKWWIGLAAIAGVLAILFLVPKKRRA